MVKEAIKKADVLIEALPYIKKFHKKIFVIKYGGSILGEEKVRKCVLENIAFLRYTGIRPILVHGGGPAITANLKKAGVESKFVNGLRVTDKDTIKVVMKTLAQVNQELVSDLTKFGAQAVGLSGYEAKILKVKKEILQLLVKIWF